MSDLPIDDTGGTPSPALPTPVVRDQGGTLPFRDSDVAQILQSARNRGPDALARAVALATEDGYRSPAEFLTAPVQSLPNQSRMSETNIPPATSIEAQAFDNSSMAPAKSEADYNINWRGIVEPNDIG